jgi:type IV pilus assembly protein PilB
MHITDEKLKDILVSQAEIIDDDTFSSARDEALRMGQTIPDVLIGNGRITEDYLAELLTPYFGAPRIDLRHIDIPTEVLELIPENYAKSKNAVVFEISENEGRKVAKVAMLDPLDYEAIEFLRVKLGAFVQPYLATPTSLRFALNQYKRQIGAQFNEIISENAQKFLSSSGETDLVKLAEAVPIVTILDNVISNAVAMNASDIHFEPMQNELLIRYRIDGVMREILTLHKVIESTLVARVKILADLQIDEHRLPQDGRFKFELYEGVTIDIRVSIVPVLYGEKVEMRLLKSSTRPLSLEDVGLSKETIKIVSEEIRKPHGMILVTGPTGSGKTTTLYAVLHILNTTKVNITTIEDPIEYEIPRVNQMQVNTKLGVTFANGLRSLLRQNPDIIMVGEIRDNETAEIAVHAALTGHLVLSSLHTNDAPSALPRLLDMGVPSFLLSSTVNMVVAQRLVRRICQFCIASIPMTPAIKQLIDAQIAATGVAGVRYPASLFKGKGCRVCGNTGYLGQVGIFEVLIVSDTIRELVMRNATAGEILKEAVKEGMTPMFEDGLKKVESGITTIDEVLRVVRE